MDGEWVLLGMSDYAEAKRIQAKLELRRVELRFKADPETCGSKTCKPRVEVWVKQTDIPVFKEFMMLEQSRDFGGLEVDHSLLGEVYDPERGQARCPACGTQFSTEKTECPDCGLMFAGG